MKKIIITFWFLIAAGIAGADTVPVTQRDCEVSDTTDNNRFSWVQYRGEARYYQTKYFQNGDVFDLSGVNTNAYLSLKASNSTNSYSITGSVYNATSGIVRVLWPSDIVLTQGVYNAFFGVPGSGEVNLASRGKIEVRDGNAAGTPTATPYYPQPVIKIIAGAGVSVSPTTGVGAVTISASGGGDNPVDSRAVTNNIDMAGYKLQDASCIDFIPTNGTVCTTEGNMYYDQDDYTIAVRTDDTNVALQVGQEFFIRVVKPAGLTVNNGQIVYQSGAQGDRPLIGLADDTTNNAVIGFATADFSSNDGWVTAQGLVRDVDTSAYTAGDVLYPSATPGAVTNVAPSADSQKIGSVLRSHASSGIIYVDLDYRETDPLSVKKTGDTMTGNLTMQADILAGSSNTIRIGSASSPFLDIYAGSQGVSFIKGGQASYLFPFDGYLELGAANGVNPENSSDDLGSTSKRWGTVYSLTNSLERATWKTNNVLFASEYYDVVDGTNAFIRVIGTNTYELLFD